ncbi:hypothetical protein ACNAW0_01090 [Micromonospora sp. SL1-18]|uniref:hypothetical protein n=1 Tax=Micromonospora sp. SL1-18 TaxID=3399128 RepID=UPI003A4E2707
MRARRLIAAASVAALAVLSLAACGRSAPTVAAYVGDTAYSIDRVNAIRKEAATVYAEQVDAAEKQGQQVPPEQRQLDLDGQDVVNLLVGLDLGKRIVAAKQVQVGNQVSVDAIGQMRHVPDTEYAKLAAEWYNIFLALGGALPSTELTDVDRGALYDALVKANVAPAGWSADEQRQVFADPNIASQATAVVALSEVLRGEVARQDVRINPRYPTLAVPAVLQLQAPTFYDLPYVDGTGPVTDISTPEPKTTDETDDTASTAPGTAS